MKFQDRQATDPTHCSCFSMTHLCHVHLRPGDVGEGGPGLDEHLREVVVVVTGGHHMQAYKNVERQGEDGQIPAAVD